MKPKILKLSLFCLVFALMGASCQDDEESLSTLNGKWILLGFGDDSTNEFIFEPETEPQSSYIIFENGKLEAFSVSNKTYDVSYKLNGELLNITNIGGITKVGGDTEWGLKFLTSIKDIHKFNMNGELILYYETQRFMKLKKE